MMTYKTIKLIETKDFSIELMGTDQGFYRVKMDSIKFQSVTIPVQNLTAAMSAFNVLYDSFELNK